MTDQHSDDAVVSEAPGFPEAEEAAASPRRRWLPLAIGIATALAVFVAALVIRSITDGGDRPDDPIIAQPPAAVAGQAPRRLLVPSIGLNAVVVPIAIAEDGVLTPPASPEVGWWRLSAVPGADHGQTLITGHTIHDGTGIMNRLGDVTAGATVEVTSRSGTVTYRTTKVEVLSKQELADNADELFGQQRRDGRLVLVTCDDWEDGEYLSNIVLFARQVDSEPSDGASA